MTDQSRVAQEIECPECHGNGFPADHPDRACPMCLGRGTVLEVASDEEAQR